MLKPDGYIDPNFKPHPILSDPEHVKRTRSIQAVAGPDVTDQIGKSVHDMAVEGGDAIPHQDRDLIGNYPMWNYHKQKPAKKWDQRMLQIYQLFMKNIFKIYN